MKIEEKLVNQEVDSIKIICSHANILWLLQISCLIVCWDRKISIFCIFPPNKNHNFYKKLQI